MKTITLPSTTIEVSRIAYGTTGCDGTLSEGRAITLVEQYAEAGGNFLDTAHCYSFWVPGGLGKSERFVGRAARALGRERFVIATKGGHVGMPPGYPRPDAFIDPEIVRRDLDESLDRLGMSQVDLYYLHRDDPRVPAEELIEAMNEHIRDGRARCIGASNWSVVRFTAANEYAVAKGLQPFVILQNQWSLARPNWTDLTSPGAVRYVEETEEETLVNLGVVVAAYSSVANGYFSTDGATGRQFESPATRRQLAVVHEIAGRHGVSPTQIALAYLLHHPAKVVPIIGTRDPEHLADSLLAVDVALTAEEFLALMAAGK